MHIRLPINIHNAMALWCHGAMVPSTRINQDHDQPRWLLRWRVWTSHEV